MEDPGNLRPVEYGLNSRLSEKDGVVFEEPYKADGLYGPAIQQICHWLEKAAGVAESPEQASYIKTLIDYYQTGDLALWDLQYGMGSGYGHICRFYKWIY